RKPGGGSAGGVEGMAKWLQVVLAQGRLPDGSRLYSEATARELTKLVTPIPIEDQPPELAGLRAEFLGYALGWGVRDYRGHKVVGHTGGLPGYVSRVLLVPDVGLGVVVLTNQEAESSHAALCYWIADYYLGAP